MHINVPYKIICIADIDESPIDPSMVITHSLIAVYKNFNSCKIFGGHYFYFLR